MQTHSIHVKTPSNPRCLTLKSPSKAFNLNSCILFGFFPSRDCNTAGICGGFGDGARRFPSSEDRDEDGREEDDAGCFETSRLALPFADASRVGEAITGEIKRKPCLNEDKSGGVGKGHGFGHSQDPTQKSGVVNIAAGV